MDLEGRVGLALHVEDCQVQRVEAEKEKEVSVVSPALELFLMAMIELFDDALCVFVWLVESVLLRSGNGCAQRVCKPGTCLQPGWPSAGCLLLAVAKRAPLCLCAGLVPVLPGLV